MKACIHYGICAATCPTQGFAQVPVGGGVVRTLHNYECTRGKACERNCLTGAIRLRHPEAPRGRNTWSGNCSLANRARRLHPLSAR